MLFSIIIPTYNRAHLIEKTIQSFITQTYPNFELLVIDDGSTDNTEQIIRNISDKRVTYYKKQKEGVSAARNYGATISKGDYINFFDSDDIAYPNHLAEAYNYFIKNRSSNIVMFDLDWSNAEMKKTNQFFLRYKNPNKTILTNNFAQVNAVFIKKSILNDVVFNTSLSMAEDWDFYLKLSVRYTFDLGKITTSCLVDHAGRTVRNFDINHFLNQKIILLNSVKSDIVFYNKQKKALNGINAHMTSYIALHAAMNKYKIESIVLFIKSAYYNPLSIFKKRTLAIIKHVFITW